MPPQLRAEPLAEWIRARIEASGPATIAQFMAWALYHPQHGYYSRGPAIGPRGDFTTSPEASPAFGRLLARHVSDIDDLLGQPPLFCVIECGPGRGTLAADLLDTLQAEQPGLYARLRYYLVEISPALTQWQQARLIPVHSGKVEWADAIEQLPQGLSGAVIGNEFIDAFPVHVVENRAGKIEEQYVAAAPDGGFQVVYGKLSDPRLSAFLTRYNIYLQPGELIEINLESASWFQNAAATLERGVVTLIDYGDTQPGRYSQARRAGTLLAYYGGAVTASILTHPGGQDITALVDFTALSDEAREVGFDPLDMLRQTAFLVGLGLGTSVAITPPPGDPPPDPLQALSYRRGVQALISMEGLGRFHVLLLSRSLDTGQARASLSGLRYSGVL